MLCLTDGNSNHGDGMYGMMKTPTSVPGVSHDKT